MSSSGPAATPLALAERAYSLVQVSPRRALTVGERALAAATSAADAGAEVAALHAVAWAQFQLGDPRALATVKTGIRIARRHGDRRGLGVLRRRLAFSHSVAGNTQAARREIAAASALLEGVEKAQCEVFRLAIHRRSSSVDPELTHAVLADAARALRLFRLRGDEIWQARLLFNRGLLHLDRGELNRAEADLGRARTLYERKGADAAAANALVLSAWLALLRGDILTCLKTLEDVQAEPIAGEIGYLTYNLAECRILALAEARLLPEARAAAEAYVDLCSRSGRTDNVAWARLQLAMIAMLALDPATAQDASAKAARSYAARRQLPSAAIARAVSLRAGLLAGNLGRSSVRSGLDAVAVLEAAGRRRDALRTRLVVARVALATGSRTTARRQLDRASALRRDGTAIDRIELLHARALIHAADGNARAAEQLLERGLRLLDEHRAALGAVELRTTVSGVGVDLARDGLRIALSAGSPDRVLAWAERLRASALRQPLVRPATDAKLRSLQVELRRAVAHEAAGDRARLEAAIRARTRIVEPDGGDAVQVADARAAARLLGRRALVEYVELDGVIYALTLRAGRLELHALGAQAATEELDWLRFAYRRLVRADVDGAQRAAARRSAAKAARRLDDLLVEPLLPAIGDAPLVIVPTGTLHTLPWAALPSLRGRAVVVAPSLSLWCGLAARPRSRRRRAALIAGPGLRHASREVRELGELRRSATVLLGASATAGATLAALDGAALAHFACHGRFRTDSPLFSSLELADGPLDVYELQNLRRAPELVVLSACDLALSHLHPGDELLGLAAALLAMGTRTVVASVVPVPDGAARRLMVGFHRRLLDGLVPSAALASAQAGARTAGFVCLGSD